MQRLESGEDRFGRRAVMRFDSFVGKWSAELRDGDGGYEARTFLDSPEAAERSFWDMCRHLGVRRVVAAR